MPLPKPDQGEQQSEFIARFMVSEIAQKEYPDEEQRLAVAYSLWRENGRKKDGVHRIATFRLDDRLDEARQDKYSITSQGFLVCPAYVTRSGIFDYYEDGKLIREYRPPEEVFNRVSMDSLKMVPVTYHHPDQMVTVENVRDFQVGITGENVNRDSDYLACTMKIMDKAIVDYVLGMHKAGQGIELSCGYDCDVIPTGGELQGQKFDAMQTNIRYNHVSIVDRGRAGRDVRLKLDQQDQQDQQGKQGKQGNQDNKGDQEKQDRQNQQDQQDRQCWLGKQDQHRQQSKQGKQDKQDQQDQQSKQNKHDKEGRKVPIKFKRKAVKLDSFTMDEINAEIPEEAGPVIDRLSEKLDEATEVIQSQDNQLKDTTKKLTESQTRVDQLQESVKKLDAIQAKLDQTTEELKKAKNDVEELSDMESPRVRATLRAKAALEATADKLKVDRKDKDQKALKIDIIKAVSSDFNPDGKSDEYINARYDSVVEFVAQAERDANNSALGAFIKHAKDSASSAPRDPRAEFIHQSQELSRGQGQELSRGGK